MNESLRIFYHYSTTPTESDPIDKTADKEWDLHVFDVRILCIHIHINKYIVHVGFCPQPVFYLAIADLRNQTFPTNLHLAAKHLWPGDCWPLWN